MLASAGADIFVMYEDTYANYISTSYQAAPWQGVSTSKLWHLVHSAPSTTAAFQNAAQIAKSRGAGWVYVTSDVLPNPWDTVPSSTLWTTLNQADGAWGTCS